jgi:hypothetical protein
MVTSLFLPRTSQWSHQSQVSRPPRCPQWESSTHRVSTPSPETTGSKAPSHSKREGSQSRKLLCISQRGHGGQVRGAKSWAPEGARFRSPTLNTCLTTPQAKLLITPSMGCPAQPNHTEAILPGFHTLPGTKSNSLAMPASPGPCLPQHFLLSGQSPWFPAGPSQARLAGKAPPLWRHPGLSSCSKLILHMFRLKAQAQGRSRLTV